MLLSVIVITARAQPQIETLMRAIDAQAVSGDVIELVLVDFLGRSFTDLDLDNTWLAQRTARPAHIGSVKLCKPKPTPYQGEHRVTSRDLHAIANARNTGFIVSSMPYLAFLDDRVTLGARWLETIREYAKRGDDDRAIAGPCDRHEFGARVRDDRRLRSPNGRGDCPGDWLYGGNFALPRALYELVNGCEEGTDPCGRQDRVLGMMLRNNGVRIDFLTSMGVVFDRDTANKPHPFPRLRPGVPPADKARAILKRYGGRMRTDPATTPDLKAMRRIILAGGKFPSHAFTADSRDWFDNTRFGDL